VLARYLAVPKLYAKSVIAPRACGYLSKLGDAFKTPIKYVVSRVLDSHSRAVASLMELSCIVTLVPSGLKTVPKPILGYPAGQIYGVARNPSNSMHSFVATFRDSLAAFVDPPYKPKSQNHGQYRHIFAIPACDQHLSPQAARPYS